MTLTDVEIDVPDFTTSTMSSDDMPVCIEINSEEFSEPQVDEIKQLHERIDALKQELKDYKSAVYLCMCGVDANFGTVRWVMPNHSNRRIEPLKLKNIR